MTVDELAAAVQAGEREVLELWAQVWRFTRWQALRWEVAYGARGGATVEDFMQAGFLALLDALNRWKPGQYAFLTVYGKVLKSAFLDACGGRSIKQQADPLRQGALSLDVSIDAEEPDGPTLGDLQPDPAAEAAMEGVVERDRAERLHNALEAALEAIPPALGRGAGPVLPGPTGGRESPGGCPAGPAAPPRVRAAAGVPVNPSRGHLRGTGKSALQNPQLSQTDSA